MYVDTVSRQINLRLNRKRLLLGTEWHGAIEVKYFKRKYNRPYLSREVVHELEQMLNELQSNQLEVVLVPSKDPRHEGHMVRKAVQRNCEWYRRFCSQYTKNPRPLARSVRTKIVRGHTERILTSMIKNRKMDMNGLYYEWILAEAHRRIDRNPF